MVECLVIGAGHCGLLCARILRDAGVDCLVVDEGKRIGDIWRRRPKNLRLFTSRQFCSLGGFTMPGDPQAYPSASEFADHVERFARDMKLPVMLRTRVTRLARTQGSFAVTLASGDVIHARTVINATGSNQEPVIPPFAARLGPDVAQATAQSYTAADLFPAGARVAVVGDGASGRQIARELSGTHRVILSRGRVRKLVPNTLLGRDIFWWLDRTGILYAGTHSPVARILRRRDPVPAAADSDQRLADAGVVLRPAAVDANTDVLVFKDGTCGAVDAVVWCVGYRERLDWMDLPSMREGMSFAGGMGLTPEAGLFVIGRKWLSCRASELILGAERDAARVAAAVIAHCRQPAPQGVTSRRLADV